MPSKGQTSVVLTRKAQELKDRAIIDHGGLKHFLSVAIEMFCELPLDEQHRRVSRARLQEAEELIREAEATDRRRSENRRRKGTT